MQKWQCRARRETKVVAPYQETPEVLAEREIVKTSTAPLVAVGLRKVYDAEGFRIRGIIRVRVIEFEQVPS